MLGIQNYSALFIENCIHILSAFILCVEVEYCGALLLIFQTGEGHLHGTNGFDLFSIVEQSQLEQESGVSVQILLFHRLLPEGNDVLVGDRLDREGDLLNRIGQGLRIAGDGDGNAVLALGGQDELLRRLLVFRLLLRQLAVAEDGGIVQLIGDVLHQSPSMVLSLMGFSSSSFMISTTRPT